MVTFGTSEVNPSGGMYTDDTGIDGFVSGVLLDPDNHVSGHFASDVGVIPLWVVVGVMSGRSGGIVQECVRVSLFRRE